MAAGLTQADLAKRIGVDRSTVSNIEGGRNPSIHVVLAWLEHCNAELLVVPLSAEGDGVDARLRAAPPPHRRLVALLLMAAAVVPQALLEDLEERLQRWLQKYSQQMKMLG